MLDAENAAPACYGLSAYADADAAARADVALPQAVGVGVCGGAGRHLQHRAQVLRRHRRAA